MHSHSFIKIGLRHLAFISVELVCFSCIAGRKVCVFNLHCHLHPIKSGCSVVMQSGMQAKLI